MYGIFALTTQPISSLPRFAKTMNLQGRGDVAPTFQLTIGEQRAPYYDYNAYPKSEESLAITGSLVCALAVARKTRMPEAPEIPTFAEAGLPAYEANGWYSMHAPAGTPAPIIAKLNAEIARVMKQSDMQERFRQLGADGGGGPPEQLTAFVKSELAKYSKVIKDAGIKAE